MQLSQDTIIFAEEISRGQRLNSNWLKFRRGRLTASNFGVVLDAIKRNRFPDSLFKTLLGEYDISRVKAVQWGIDLEETAVRTYEETFQMKTRECGIFLETSGILGASPDRLVGTLGLLEVKCPYKYRDQKIAEAISDKGFYLFQQNGFYQLREDHPYYHQVQGQLHVADKLLCTLVVWTTQDCVFVRVKRDVNWAHNLELLRMFYRTKLLPKLLQGGI